MAQRPHMATTHKAIKTIAPPTTSDTICVFGLSIPCITSRLVKHETREAGQAAFLLGRQDPCFGLACRAN